jgi:hypothetical protein
LNQFVDFHEIHQGGHAIDGDLNPIISNPIASTIFTKAEVQTSEVDTKRAPVSLGLSRVKFGNRGNQTIVV